MRGSASSDRYSLAFRGTYIMNSNNEILNAIGEDGHPRSEPKLETVVSLIELPSRKETEDEGLQNKQVVPRKEETSVNSEANVSQLTEDLMEQAITGPARSIIEASQDYVKVNTTTRPKTSDIQTVAAIPKEQAAACLQVFSVEGKFNSEDNEVQKIEDNENSRLVLLDEDVKDKNYQEDSVATPKEQTVVCRQGLSVAEVQKREVNDKSGWLVLDEVDEEQEASVLSETSQNEATLESGYPECVQLIGVTKGKPDAVGETLAATVKKQSGAQKRNLRRSEAIARGELVMPRRNKLKDRVSTLKRLSGAQRRKVRRYQVIAKGKPVISRKKKFEDRVPSVASATLEGGFLECVQLKEEPNAVEHESDKEYVNKIFTDTKLLKEQPIVNPESLLETSENEQHNEVVKVIPVVGNEIREKKADINESCSLKSEDQEVNVDPKEKDFGCPAESTTIKNKCNSKDEKDRQSIAMEKDINNLLDSAWVLLDEICEDDASDVDSTQQVKSSGSLKAKETVLNESSKPVEKVSTSKVELVVDSNKKYVSSDIDSTQQMKSSINLKAKETLSNKTSKPVEKVPTIKMELKETKHQQFIPLSSCKGLHETVAAVDKESTERSENKGTTSKQVDKGAQKNIVENQNFVINQNNKGTTKCMTSNKNKTQNNKDDDDLNPDKIIWRHERNKFEYKGKFHTFNLADWMYRQQLIRGGLENRQALAVVFREKLFYKNLPEDLVVLPVTSKPKILQKIKNKNTSNKYKESLKKIIHSSNDQQQMKQNCQAKSSEISRIKHLDHQDINHQIRVNVERSNYEPLKQLLNQSKLKINGARKKRICWLMALGYDIDTAVFLSVHTKLELQEDGFIDRILKSQSKNKTTLSPDPFGKKSQGMGCREPRQKWDSSLSNDGCAKVEPLSVHLKNDMYKYDSTILRYQNVSNRDSMSKSKVYESTDSYNVNLEYQFTNSTVGHPSASKSNFNTGCDEIDTFHEDSFHFNMENAHPNPTDFNAEVPNLIQYPEQYTRFGRNTGYSQKLLNTESTVQEGLTSNIPLQVSPASNSGRYISDTINDTEFCSVSKSFSQENETRFQNKTPVKNTNEERVISLEMRFEMKSLLDKGYEFEDALKSVLQPEQRLRFLLEIQQGFKQNISNIYLQNTGDEWTDFHNFVDKMEPYLKKIIGSGPEKCMVYQERTNPEIDKLEKPAERKKEIRSKRKYPSESNSNSRKWFANETRTSRHYRTSPIHQDEDHVRSIEDYSYPLNSQYMMEYDQHQVQNPEQDEVRYPIQNKKRKKSEDYPEDSDKPIKVAVMSCSFPDVLLTTSQIKLVQENILELIMRDVDKVSPKFLHSSFEDGYLCLTCQDKATADWLKINSRLLKPWKGADLRALYEYEVAKLLMRTIVVVFPNSCEYPTDKILGLVKAQNSELFVNKWRVVQRAAKGTKLTEMSIDIDLDSAKILEEQGMKLSYMFGTVDCVDAQKKFSEDVNSPKWNSFPTPSIYSTSETCSHMPDSPSFGCTSHTSTVRTYSPYESDLRKRPVSRSAERQDVMRGQRETGNVSSYTVPSVPLGSDSARTIWENVSPVWQTDAQKLNSISSRASTNEKYEDIAAYNPNHSSWKSIKDQRNEDYNWRRGSTLTSESLEREETARKERSRSPRWSARSRPSSLEKGKASFRFQ